MIGASDAVHCRVSSHAAPATAWSRTQGRNQLLATGGQQNLVAYFVRPLAS